MVLLNTIQDETYNHTVAAGDAGADLWIGFVGAGKWITWSGTWPRLTQRMQMHIHEAFTYIVDSNGVHKNGVGLYVCQLIRQGQGFIYLDKGFQGTGVPAITVRDTDAEWGIAVLSRNAGHVATDVIATSIRYKRRLA